MVTSIAGRKLIESFEGLRLTSYQDSRGIWTIGYGHTSNVFANETITQEEADNFLGIDLHQAETPIYTYVNVTLNQNQFDALVSLIYNIGSGAFAKSTVLRELNMGDMQKAADAFLMWDKPGLLARRQKERALFLEVPNVNESV